MNWLSKVFQKEQNPVERKEPEFQPTTETGTRSTDDARLRAMYEQMIPSYENYQKILDIRRMDQLDGTVKRIHHKTSHLLTKGLLTLENPSKNKRLEREWKHFERSLKLNKRAKLASDARGLIMEGNLPLQWVLDEQRGQVVRGIRMPSETIRILVDDSGQIKDRNKAYAQYDYLQGRDTAFFAYWQMNIARLDPLNFDDEGELGRPFLDATRKIWRQVTMTSDDSVIRRRERAPLRTAHFLEGAKTEALAAYKQEVEGEQQEITTNYYSNTKGSVQAIQGDANLDQVADISLLLDGFFAGTPLPKGLIYSDGLSRDVLMDLKSELYEELDILQDLQAETYEDGFRLHLLIRGINPDAIEFKVKFAELLTETLNQRADRGLKLKALGASQHTALSTAGLDPNKENTLLEDEDDLFDPYPTNQRVSVTQNNMPKGESSTHVSNQ